MRSNWNIRIGRPNLIVCLDSGCANYDQLWVTTSLRGALTGRLKVEVLSEGVHSGSSSGIVPDTFRIARQIVSRLENEMTGEVVPEWLYVDIPEKVKVRTIYYFEIICSSRGPERKISQKLRICSERRDS